MQFVSRALIFFGITIAINNLVQGTSHAQNPLANLSLDPADSWNLMLVGGSMRTCSSMASSHCETTDWINPETIRTHNGIQLNNAAIQRILNSESWQNDRLEIRDELVSALRKTQGSIKGNNLKFDDFRSRFSSIYANLWRNLTDREYFLLRDSIQVPYSELPTEQINFEASTESAGVELFETFVERARALSGIERPRIIVVTASARDSFDAVDFYLQAFRHFGAEVTWLPLDAATGQAIAAGRCEDIDKIRENVQNSFYQARKSPVLAERQLLACTQPEMLTRTIEAAHGIFFNGGDQSLTLQGFIAPDNTPFPWLTALQQRVQAGEMIAGGTSAGTAVMSAAHMISNGSGRPALIAGAVRSPFPPAIDCERMNNCGFPAGADQLTYRAEGGLGLFPMGITDTHFSERGRQIRLLRLAADTNTRLGVGIDEATALLIDTQSGAFQVQGAHGVFMISNAYSVEQEGPESAGIMAEFHYFRNGSGGVIHDQEIKRTFVS